MEELKRKISKRLFTEAQEDDGPWWRSFIFSDAKRHGFIETTMSRAPKEIGCAFAASFLVSPLVSIIDKCIVQDISRHGTFAGALKHSTVEMIIHPKKFFGGLSFRLTFAVYFGTYAVANLSELFLDVKRVRDDEKRKQGKVMASSVANISLLAWRDSVFARIYGSGSQTETLKTPYRTLGLFAARDACTMYATFYLAPQAAKYLQTERGWEKNTAELSMALGIPALSQFATAPMHIHAMDYFNRPQSISFPERMATIASEFHTVAFARGLRILPAFGIGSFSNNKFRELFIRGHNENKLLNRKMSILLDKATQKAKQQKDSKQHHSVVN